MAGQTVATTIDPAVERASEELRNKFKALRAEIGKAIVGHEEVVERVRGTGTRFLTLPSAAG